jgi:hypothetical protein
MPRLADRYLAAVVEGFDKAEHGGDLLPQVLARACVAVLPVMGAGLGLAEKLRVPLGGSDDAVGRAERLQTTLGEGPCLAAIEAGRALTAGEPEIAARWPAYHRELVRQTPFRAVASLPLRVPGQPPVGALDLYTDDVRMPPHAANAEVQAAIADQISGLLFDAPLVRADWTDEPVAAWLAGPAVAGRMQVWEAVGMVMQTLAATQGEGLALLREYAQGHDATLDAVAERLVTEELAPTALLEDQLRRGTQRAPDQGCGQPSGYGFDAAPPAVGSLADQRRRESGGRRSGRL